MVDLGGGEVEAVHGINDEVDEVLGGDPVPQVNGQEKWGAAVYVDETMSHKLITRNCLQDSFQDSLVFREPPGLRRFLKSDRLLGVIVDGLDHIARVFRDAPTVAAEETEIARDLLALQLPHFVSVIVGSQPGDHIAQLAKAGTLLTVPSWDEPAVKAFLQRSHLGQELAVLNHDNERKAFISDLTVRSEGNALYCTYLCREVEQRLRDKPGEDPLLLLRSLPPSCGTLATYYEWVLGSKRDKKSPKLLKDSEKQVSKKCENFRG